MSLKPSITKLKETMKETGNVTEFPDQGNSVVVVKESDIRGSYSVSIGVGEIARMTGKYFEINGKVFNDRFHQFTDSMLKIEPYVIKKNRAENYLCAVYSDDLLLEVIIDVWDDKFKNV